MRHDKMAAASRRLARSLWTADCPVACSSSRPLLLLPSSTSSPLSTSRKFRCGRYNYHSLHRRAISTSPYSSAVDATQHEPSSHSSSASPFASPSTTSQKRAQTLTEKIVQKYAYGLPEGKTVRSGDYISLQPAYCMTHDNTWPVALKFMSIGATQIRDPAQLVYTVDHDIQNTSESNLKKYRQIEQFAKQHQVQAYAPGRGIGHQIMVEEGYAWPGTMCVASDSHSNHYGGVGCLGTPIVRSDAMAVWATSRTWWQIPPIARVTFTGMLPPYATGKDIIVALTGLFNNDVLNHAVEFTGSEETMASLPIDSRITIANMSTEWGALSGLFPIDKTLESWLRNKAAEAQHYDTRTTRERIYDSRIDELFANPLVADADAVYGKQLYLNLSTICPYVSGPNSVKVANPLHSLAPQNIKVDRAYIVSCTNSRASDLAAAAKVFKDAAKANPGTTPKIAQGVKLYIAAASAPEQEAAEASGDWQTLLDAGAQALPAGCGPCIGLGTGLLEAGEVGISASNRNFKARMGHKDAQAYLASPEVVAASALKGVISGPGVYEVPAGWSGVEHGYGTGAEPTTENQLSNFLQQLESLVERVEASEGPDGAEAAKVDVLPGFPQSISGTIVFCDADNLNTDGIYGGKYTYMDDITKETMAHVCMENYDANFRDIAQPGDILVSGFNFGTGSSREQAATALLAKQIPLVIAGSLGNVFGRNAINNSLVALELPRLVERLRARYSDKKPTVRTDWTLTWDVRRSSIEVQEGPGGETWSEPVGELAPNVQEIIAAGGLEPWVKAEIGKATSS